jgi:hypothetical protein
MTIKNSSSDMVQLYRKCLELAMDEDLNYINVSKRFIQIVEATSIHTEPTHMSETDSVPKD